MKVLILACVSPTETELKRIADIDLQLAPNANPGTALLLLLGEETTVFVAEDTAVVTHQQREN